MRLELLTALPHPSCFYCSLYSDCSARELEADWAAS